MPHSSRAKPTLHCWLLVMVMRLMSREGKPTEPPSAKPSRPEKCGPN